MTKKVKIISYTNDAIRFYVPSLRVNRLFEKYGQSFLFDADIVEEMFYYPSIENLFVKGLFYIDDKELRVKLNLEEDDGTVAETVTAPISDATILAHLKTKPIGEFKKYVENLPIEQQMRFVDVAVANKILDYEKNMFLKEITGKDIMKIIQLNEEE
jgi:hypothetical protein